MLGWWTWLITLVEERSRSARPLAAFSAFCSTLPTKCRNDRKWRYPNAVCHLPLPRLYDACSPSLVSCVPITGTSIREAVQPWAKASRGARLIRVAAATIPRAARMVCLAMGGPYSARFPAAPQLAGAVVLATAEGAVQVGGGGDEPEVGEGLGEVPEGLAGGPGFLRVQPEVVRVAEHLLEDEARRAQPVEIRLSRRPHQRLHQPERADVEGALVPLDPVRAARHVVAVDEAVRDQPPVLAGAVDGVERRQHPRVARGDEVDERHHQHGGVEVVAAVRLHEGLALLVPPVGHDVVVDR